MHFGHFHPTTRLIWAYSGSTTKFRRLSELYIIMRKMLWIAKVMIKINNIKRPQNLTSAWLEVRTHYSHLPLQGYIQVCVVYMIFYKHNVYKHIQAQIRHFVMHMLRIYIYIYPSLVFFFCSVSFIRRKRFQETCKQGLKNSNLFAFEN